MSTTSPAPPEGFTEVSREEFYEALKADPRDIMPKLNSPEYTDWETVDRQRWGWSYPGWKNIGEPSIYAIKSKRGV